MIDEEVTIGNLKAKLTSTNEYVVDCQKRVSKGEVVEMSGLDKTVSKICEDIVSLNDVEDVDIDEIKEDMAALLTNLDDLAKNIKEQHGVSEGE